MQRFTSRKFLLTLLSVVIVFVNAVFDLGITSEQLLQINAVIGAYIGAEGAKDYIVSKNESMEE